jgi:hypothetical protein
VMFLICCADSPSGYFPPRATTRVVHQSSQPISTLGIHSSSNVTPIIVSTQPIHPQPSLIIMDNRAPSAPSSSTTYISTSSTTTTTGQTTGQTSGLSSQDNSNATRQRKSTSKTGFASTDDSR